LESLTFIPTLHLFSRIPSSLNIPLVDWTLTLSTPSNMSAAAGPSKTGAHPPGKGKAPVPPKDVKMKDDSSDDSDEEEVPRRPVPAQAPAWTAGPPGGFPQESSQAAQQQPAPPFIINNPQVQPRTKVPKPDFFYGERSKFEAWALQIDLYFYFTPEDENRKAVLATTYLRGPAEHWVKPFLNRYMAGTDNTGMFSSWGHLKQALKSVFGISNEVSQAIRVIQNLKQKGSASEFTAKFQEYAHLTTWNDDALMEMYRRGLKDEVKDELMRSNATIEEMGDLTSEAIRIDDMLYERRMERKYDNSRGRKIEVGRPNYQANVGRHRRGGGRREQPYYGPQPMELDNVQRKKGKKPGPKDKKTMTCYACGKPGHMAKDCDSKNKVQRTQINATTKETNSTEDKPIQAVSHGSLNWTFCTDDSCATHFTSKSDAGWFPQPKRGRGGHHEVNAIIRLTAGEAAHYVREAGETDDDIEIDDSEDDDEIPSYMCDSEDEDELPTYTESQEEAVVKTRNLGVIEETSDEEEDDDTTEYTFSVDGPQVVWDLCRMLQKSRNQVFPVIGGHRRLCVRKFDQLLQSMRDHVWAHRLTDEPTNTNEIVRIQAPIGSLFTSSGFTTPDGIYFNHDWMKRHALELMRAVQTSTRTQERKVDNVAEKRIMVARNRNNGYEALKWFATHAALPSPEAIAEFRRQRESRILNLRSEN